MQSVAATSQVFLHESGPQRYCLQPVTSASEHFPLPLQVRPLVWVPFEQEAGSPQVLPEGACSHLWSEPHNVLLPHSPFAAHMPWGSGASVPTLVQFPRWPVRLQAWQSPQEGVLQQTPSKQVPPIAHGALSLQGAPMVPSAVHTPAVQCAPPAQSPLLEHGGGAQPEEAEQA